MKRAGWLVAAVVLALLLAAIWPWLQSDAPPEPAATQAGLATEPAVDAVPAASPAPPPPQEKIIQAVTEIGVPVRIVQRLPLHRPDAPYGPAYPALLAQAQSGDRPAQYRLGLMLYECREVPEDEAVLRRQIETLYQTRHRGNWDVSDPEAEAAEMTRSHRDCAGIPQQARGQYRDWLKSAADGGLVEAQLDMMYHLPQREFCQYLYQCTPEQRRAQETLQAESVHYLTLARDAGSAAALWTFGAWYQGDEVLPRDDIQAYAYYRALDQIQAAAGQERRFSAMLKSLGQRLRPIDREQAETQARDLLQNPRCCLLTR